MSEKEQPIESSDQFHYEKGRLLSNEELEFREFCLTLIIGIDQNKLNKLKDRRPALYSLEAIEKHVNGLNDRKFKDPREMIRTSLSILNFGLKYIDGHINGLAARGFVNSHKTIESAPRILEHPLECIDSKITDLRKRGFLTPVSLIERLPRILDFNMKNIDEKISGLNARGFTDPIHLIESCPSILCLSLNNIDAKIEVLERLNKLYKLDLNPIKVIEQNTTLISTKLEKIFILARILREYKPTADEIKRKINPLYTTNLESMILSYTQKRPDDTISNLIYNAREIQSQKFSNKEKRISIDNFFQKQDEPNKIYRDYIRAYPIKKMK